MPSHDEGGEDDYVSIPLGGPIYVSDLVGPLTRVPHFENSVIQELEVCCLYFACLLAVNFLLLSHLTDAIAYYLKNYCAIF